MGSQTCDRNSAQNSSQSTSRQATQARAQIQPSIAIPATPSPQSGNSELPVSGTSDSFSVVSIWLTCSPLPCGLLIIGLGSLAEIHRLRSCSHGRETRPLSVHGGRAPIVDIHGRLEIGGKNLQRTMLRLVAPAVK